METFKNISLKIDYYNQIEFYEILSNNIENLSITYKNGAIKGFIKRTPFRLEQLNKYEDINLYNVSEDVLLIILQAATILNLNQINY